MTPSRSLFRTAAVTGVAAFLLSFAHVSPAAAQVSTRYATTCTAQAQQADWNATCAMTVPAGKVFIIESATAHGAGQLGQRFKVTLRTKFQQGNRTHAFVAGFPLATASGMYWTGAIPGTIFSEGEHSDVAQIVFEATRSGTRIGTPWFVVTLSGHLEDM